MSKKEIREPGDPLPTIIDDDDDDDKPKKPIKKEHKSWKDDEYSF